MDDFDNERTSVQQQVTAYQSQIDVNQAKINTMENMIQSVDLKIAEHERVIIDVVREIKDIEIALGAATTTQDMEMLNQKWNGLANDKWDLNQQIKQLRDEKFQLRNYSLACFTKSERLSVAMTALEISRQSTEMWNLDNMDSMLQREMVSLPTGTPAEFIGRKIAMTAVQRAAMQNFRNRTSVYHRAFTFLVASGHVMSGKTRSGIETPRLVEELCSRLSRHGDNNGIRFAFTKPVYLLVDFRKNARVHPVFDAKHQDASVALGARLMCAFYKHATLKVIRHDQALKHIIETILKETRARDSLIVPIVIHFDGHDEFIQGLNKLKNREMDGQSSFEDMLLCLGESATSSAGAVSDLQRDGRFFLVPITTGTSQKDASFSEISCYTVKAVPLPPLSFAKTRELASAFLNGRNDKNKILDDTVFQIALADCGGLPGLVQLLCQQIDARGQFHGFQFHAQVQEMINLQEGWDHCWKSLFSIFLARPKLWPDDFSEGENGFRHAVDSGMVSYDPDEREIGLAPVLFNTFNTRAMLCNPLLLKAVTEAHDWNRQDFKEAHMLYLAATMMSLQREQSRFNEMTLGTFLRHVQPGDNTYLLQNLILPPDVAFDGIMYQCDDEQCLDRPPRRELHSVDITNENQVILSKPGTPFVDAYINLRLHNKTGERTDLPTTLFVHYEHSTMRRPPKLKVSAMNKVINELLTTLVAMQWDIDRLWLFLWVTNRPIGVNAKPHEKLLWVGQDNFEKHAPLIACRGLVRPGEQGQDESERYLTLARMWAICRRKRRRNH